MLLLPLLLLPRALAMEVPPVGGEVTVATTAQPATSTGRGRKRRAGGKYTVQEEVSQKDYVFRVIPLPFLSSQQMFLLFKCPRILHRPS
jgi:hypothetical protein